MASNDMNPKPNKYDPSKDETLVRPDRAILRDIFPSEVAKNISLDDCKVISTSSETCVFHIRLDASPVPGWPVNLLIRLDDAAASGCSLAAVTELQHLARFELRDLIPKVLLVGSATSLAGRNLEFSVRPYLYGTMAVLDDVWSGLSPENQRALVDAAVGAMVKLQKLLAVKRPRVRRFLHAHAHPDTDIDSGFRDVIGGPNGGYFDGIKQLLQACLGEERFTRRVCEIVDTEDGIAVRSTRDDIGSVELSQSDMDDLMKHAVLCHNDLEPRSIFVRRVDNRGSGSSNGWYELAAIFDWQSAGFFPFAYEYANKDGDLGSVTRWTSWYLLYKERATSLLPKGESHEKLIRALDIITRSRDVL